jgi:hypothetical protein
LYLGNTLAFQFVANVSNGRVNAYAHRASNQVIDKPTIELVNQF